MGNLQKALQQAIQEAKWLPPLSGLVETNDSCISFDAVQLLRRGMSLEVFLNKHPSLQDRMDYLVSQGLSLPDALLEIETGADMNCSENDHSREQDCRQHPRR